MTPHSIEGRGYRRFFVNQESALSYFTAMPPPPPAAITTSMGLSWSNHVTANNAGSTPSATAQTAVSVFWTRLVNDGLAPLMYSINVFTDNVTASATPITSSVNQWLWTNAGFVSTDLDKNGIYCSGSSKYFDTLMTCAATFTSSNDVGVSVYFYSSDAGTTYQSDFGILGTQRVFYGQCSGSTSYFDFFAVSGGRISGVPSGSGLVSYNRTSNTTAACYFFNSAFPSGSHQTIASSTGLSQTTMPAGNMWCFRLNGDGNNRNTNKQSFVAVHRGMTEAQAAKFYNAVQQLRIDLGGGYR